MTDRTTSLRDHLLSGEDAGFCPVCFASVTKDGGCNTMRCTTCTSWFCWQCTKPIIRLGGDMDIVRRRTPPGISEEAFVKMVAHLHATPDDDYIMSFHADVQVIINAGRGNNCTMDERRVAVPQVDNVGVLEAMFRNPMHYIEL